MPENLSHRKGPSAELFGAHAVILEKMDQFNEALRSIHFEGKLYTKRNLEVIRQVVKFLNTDLARHIREDEQAIFPFLEKRVPKLSPILSLLRADHSEFRDSLREFEEILNCLQGAAQTHDEFNEQLVRLREKGIYLICLMRNHLQAENEGAYHAIDQYLNEEEKRELAGRIRSFREGTS